MQERMRAKALKMLSDGQVARVLGWKKGDFEVNPEPAFFTAPEELDKLIYNKYCSANLSGYMVKMAQQEGNTLVFLKPCDTYSFNQLLKENRVDKDKTYIIGVNCGGNVAVEEMEEAGYLERCLVCEKTEHAIFDELITDESLIRPEPKDRFEGVTDLENKTNDQRFEFWRGELSRCIRCNACRNACPACTCKKCIFNSSKYDTEQKANVNQFEERMFHIIRAYHVAGRCTDCGECSRVCPTGIKLHLLNRKVIKDIDEMDGEYV